MAKNRRNITIIACGLILLFGFSLFNYYPVKSEGTLGTHQLAIALFFLVLFLSMFGVIAMKEWARKTLVAVSVAMCAYLLILIMIYPDFVEPVYIFLNIATILFYSQPSIKYRFRTDLQFTRKSILVVDDDEGLQKTMQGILLPNGYSVLTATTGEKGIQVATLQQPDLIILDVILPGIKGRDVCAKLKESEKTKNIPVIFLTSKDSPDDVEAEIAAGAETHLTKPVNARVLLSEIKKTLKKS